MNWEALTAISTFLIMVATFWLAITALQAKNSWKEERNERHKLDVLHKANVFLINIQEHLSILSFIEASEPIEQEDYLIELHQKLISTADLCESLNYLNLNDFSNKIMQISINANNCPIFQMGINKTKISTIKTIDDKFDIEMKTLINKSKAIMDLILKAKTICDSEIQKIYNN